MSPPIVLKAFSQLPRLLPTTYESFDLNAELPWVDINTHDFTGNWLGRSKNTLLASSV